MPQEHTNTMNTKMKYFRSYENVNITKYEVMQANGSYIQ